AGALPTAGGPPADRRRTARRPPADRLWTPAPGREDGAVAAYVDPIRHYPSTPWRSKHWCHLTADTRDELHALADRIGLRRESFQDHAYRWHYDLVPEARAIAEQLGAQEVTSRDMVRRMRARATPTLD